MQYTSTVSGLKNMARWKPYLTIPSKARLGLEPIECKHAATLAIAQNKGIEICFLAYFVI